jgi:DNA repair protein RadD
MLTPRPYQQAAITAIYRYFEKESGNPLIVIPTAGGKSLVMAAFI